MTENNKVIELKDDELEKVSGGDNNNTPTAQQLIEEFMLRIGKNNDQTFPTTRTQDVGIEFVVPKGKKS